MLYKNLPYLYIHTHLHTHTRTHTFTNRRNNRSAYGTYKDMSMFVDQPLMLSEVCAKVVIRRGGMAVDPTRESPVMVRYKTPLYIIDITQFSSMMECVVKSV